MISPGCTLTSSICNVFIADCAAKLACAGFKLRVSWLNHLSALRLFHLTADLYSASIKLKL